MMVLAEELRISIFQAALRGQLTKQLETDGSVDILLSSIQAKKQQMIKDGIIKKEKKLSPILDNNIFDIPSNWRWAKMQYFLDVRDGTHDSPKYQPSGIPLITSKNISSGVLDFSDVNYISQEDADKINQRSLVEENDILLAMIGSIGNPVKVHKDREFAIKNMALIKSIPNTGINMDYVLLLLKYMQFIMKNDSNGGVQKFVSLSYLRDFPVPVPPIEEQQRIVERVNALMSLINEYEKIEKQLSALKATFPTDMRNAILQAAMQGKLTEQLETDGSVEDLLTELKSPVKVSTGRNRKKSKQLNIETFDIPVTWKWAKLSDCGTTNIGLTYSPQDISDTGGTIVLRSSNIQNGRMDYEDIIRVRIDVPESKMCHTGDILICARNGSKRLVGKSAIIDKEGMAFGAFMAIYRSKCNPYINYVLSSPHFRKSVLGGAETTTINQVTQDMIENYMIPLPPIEEQQRIVERLNTLLTLCDELEMD